MASLIASIEATLMLSGCAVEPVSSEGLASVSVAVAPLTLPGVGKVCYDLRVSDGPSATDPTVWSKGTPGLNGGTPDMGAICSSSFGNGTGGDITFVGACVASPPDASKDYRTNSVTLWVDGLYDASNAYIDPAGAEGWQNPCPAGCTLTANCRENADTFVEFNLTILRQANQGFFDIGVNFEDIFCSAKVDCRDAAGEPLKLLFRPGTGSRDTTVVSALACTAGPGSAVQTVLYRNPLAISCSGSSTVLVDPRGDGNAWSTDPAPSDVIYQAATYASAETITCGGQPCQKRYWNVALGLDLSKATNCTLATSMTASNGDMASFSTPTASTYPVITVNVPLTTSGALTCSKHPLNGTSLAAGVGTNYTPVATPAVFDYDFDGADFGQRISGQHRYWRFIETSVTVGHSPRTAELRWKDVGGTTRTPVAVTTNITQNSEYNAGLPFDGLTNTADQGWIASFSGANTYITADFGSPGYAMSEFGAFTSYTGGTRGAMWKIQWSDDNTNWKDVATFNYTTCNGCASENATGYGGWYTVSWSQSLN
jgi:hypothetical protein